MPELITLGCQVTTLHQRTDGCAGQYKSKHSFGIISTSEGRLNVKHIASYSASGHGKGEVDQAAGFLKTAAKRAVIGNIDMAIRDAKELYEFAETYLISREISPSAQLSQRRFFYVDAEDVKGEHDKDKYGTIQGTHGLHSVASTGCDGKINVRELTCYCQECVQEQCENKSHVTPFREIFFGSGAGDIVETDSVEDDSGDSTDTTPLDYTNLIGMDSFVAIKPSSDAIYSFFLLHVTSDGVYELEKDTTSQYGHTYLAGTKVVKGHFLNYQKTTREGHLYKQDPKTEAIVPQECVLYYGIDIQSSTKKPDLHVLQNVDHEDILLNIAL